jgi:FkbM family methyltransferase
MVLALSLRSILKHINPVPEKTIVEVNKSKMIVLPKKRGIHYELFLYKKREPICTDYLINSVALKEGDVVLDIGANIGYYVLVESQLIGERGKIYAVEPVQSNFELLKENLLLNNIHNVCTFNIAFGEKSAKSKIYISDKSNLCSMNREGVGGKILGSEEVTIFTVDSFLRDKVAPNFIRMDVEGYEYEILKGMPQTLRSNIKMLIELHPWRPFLDPAKMSEILDILEQNQFIVKFAVFEDKVKENKVIRVLLKKAGSKLPLVTSNISIEELRNLLADNPRLASPNVLFVKQT